MPEAMRFAGRSIIVTGAAGGIGAATAQRFAAEGADVLLADMSPAVAGVAAGLRQASLVVDIAAAGAGTALAQAALDAFGRIDVLVNNAGVGGSKRLDQTDDALLDRMIEVNLTATMRVTRDILPHLQRPGGRIVNVSSIFGHVGAPGTAAYAVAKAGIAQFTRQLAGDLAGEGILVNAIAPGVVETAMTAAALKDPRYIRLHLRGTPLNRAGLPAEQAAVIAFLASDDASFVTGAVIPVDGGYLAARCLPPVEEP